MCQMILQHPKAPVQFDPPTDPIVVIAEEHALVQSRNASEALMCIVDACGPEMVEAILDYCDITGGTVVVRRRLANLRKDRQR
jgi:hypothetical protein